MSDFRVRVSVQNARLITAIEARYGTQTELAKLLGVNLTAVNALVGMRTLPYTQDGEWKELALNIAGALMCDPEDLWPDHIKDIKIRRAAQTTVSFDQVAQIVDVEKRIEQRQLIGAISKQLTARELTAVTMHAEDATYDDIARAVGGVSRERARQILVKAMRKMRFAAKARLGIDSYKDASL